MAASSDIDAFYIKDPGGLLTPQRARTLIPAILAEIGDKPLELHNHCTIGLAEPACLEAAELGVAAVQCASGGAADGTSNPPIERMIANLVENAIRHNLDHGFVRVETGMEKPTGLRRQHAAGVGTSAAWLRVSNGGSIIPPEDAGRLFERFYRRDRSRSRSTGGFGLGLSIVKAVAEAHEGSVTAVAPPEGGLVVTVRLPAVLA